MSISSMAVYLCFLAAFKYGTSTKLRGRVLRPHAFSPLCYHHRERWLHPHEPQDVQFSKHWQEWRVLLPQPSSNPSASQASPEERWGPAMHRFTSWTLSKFLMGETIAERSFWVRHVISIANSKYLYKLYIWYPCNGGGDTFGLIIWCPVLICSPTPTAWLERPLNNHRMSHSSAFEQSNDWVMVRHFFQKCLFL